MISKSIRCFLVLILVVGLPLLAQTGSKPATPAIQTVGTNPNPPGGHMDHKPAVGNHVKSTTTATTAATTTATTTTTTTATKKKTTHRMSGSAKTRIYNDSTRLASLLQDVQSNANVSEAMWKTVANEANALANRIYGYTSGNATARAAARDLRTHVREMRTAALAGDAPGARSHAGQALPFAYTLIDWSAPK